MTACSPLPSVLSLSTYPGSYLQAALTAFSSIAVLISKMQHKNSPADAAFPHGFGQLFLDYYLLFNRIVISLSS